MTIESKRLLLIICLAAILIRFAYVLTYVDLNDDNYWEYGEIAKNVYNGKGYSLYYYSGDTLKIDYRETAMPHPSALMSPGYVFYLLPFVGISNIVARNLAILGSQILIAVLVVLVVFKFTQENFSRVSGYVAALIVAFLPEFVYATMSHTPTVHFHLLFLILLFVLYRYNQRINTSTLTLVPLLLSILVYFRTEFAVYALLIFITFALRRQFRLFFFGYALTLLFVLPWQLRNSYVFRDICVPFSTGFGLNFYRGHNPYWIGHWGDEQLYDQLRVHGRERTFELTMNRIFSNAAMKVIAENPGREAIYAIKKIAHLWFFNTGDERTQNILYIVPWFILLVFSAFGLAGSFSWQKHLFAYIFFIYSTLIAVVFFAQPRHQTMMKIALIPFAAYGVEMLGRLIPRIIRHIRTVQYG